ncbi:MAG: dihydrolipoamide acetyltransferase family protein [Woeseiaceae bacterium]|nr:dihydrolipoamide acetyltransferase family protein [Woeseiaceae bacterium]MDX2609087.1 dihydrolipoamide acetyltransferase family protein [Woeseiaceae bacterium]
MSEYIFKLPDLGEGTVESEIAEWFIKVGEQVSEEDVVGTMMTDKAAVELSSPISGTVVKLAGEPGDIVAVGAALVVFETDSDLVKDVEEPAAPTADVETAAATTTERPSSTPRKRVMTSPAVRLRARNAGIDLALITGSGPGGRITRQDFDAFVGAPHGRDRGHSPLPQAAPLATAETKEIKVIGLRRIIADRMATATREIPHFTYVEEIDITELEELRKHLNSKKVDKSERLTILPLLGLALMRALREFPQCNATYDKDRNVILQHGAVHLGVATQTSDGLKVPVVRNANAYSIDDLAAEIRRVTEAARNNSIKRDELSGSTITITSLGKLGGIASTPVINMPEVGIIGVNRAVERPVVLNGQVAVRLMMNLSSSFDHRFVDGYDAAAMIQRIKEMLEHPATIFL